MRNTHDWSRPPFLAVALISAAALAYEVLLFRLYAMIQWHHFAGMIISQALLGFGVSGIFLLLFPRLWRERMRTFFLINLWLFAFAMPLAFLAAQQVGFNTLAIFTDAQQWLRLGMVYLCLALPFFFVANAIGAVLSYYTAYIARAYAFDLTGAGLGAMGIVFLLWHIEPAQMPWVLGTLVAVTGAVLMRGRLSALVMLLAFALVAWNGAGRDGGVAVSPYKSLSQTLRIPGARIIEQRHGPLGWLAVVESPDVPLRIAPGMSINTPRTLPDQLGLFLDGEGPLAINRMTSADDLGFFEALPSALAFETGTIGTVFITGAGGGMAIQQAWRAGATRITVAEPNAQLRALLTGTLAHDWGWPQLRTHVELLPADARGALETSTQQFDIIYLDDLLTDAATGNDLGAYRYTVEALHTYLARLAPGGMLAIALQIRTPPRESLKLFATAIAGLGPERAAERMVLLRGWRSALLLVRNEPWPVERLSAIRAKAETRGFDLVWLPGMTAAEANRFHVLREAYFHDAARALLGARAAGFMHDYKFELLPATDDRPFFGHFFKWRILPELWTKRQQGSLVFLDAGYPLLWWQMVQALVVSGLLILLPLTLKMRGHGRGLWRWSTYFTALGLGFLMIEIAYIQKLGLILLHPVYSAAAVLGTFLVFAGLGSLAQPALQARAERHGWSFLGVLVVLLAASVLVQGALFPRLFEVMAPWPLTARLAGVILMLAPVAFLMGMPFPYALSRLANINRDWLPWAWGINGFASVVASPLALIVAIDLGFNAVMVVALGIYGLAALVLPDGYSASAS